MNKLFLKKLSISLSAVITLGLFTYTHARADVELLIVGSQAQPVKFVLLPLDYVGTGVNPAVTIENHLIQALSSTGLFSMPLKHEPPKDERNMLAWQLAGIRYVLQGEIHESDQQLNLKLTINDTLGLQPTASVVILNPGQLMLSSQLFADQLYRSLFYATFTNDNERQYLNQENPVLTRYLNQLVMAFKLAWQSQGGQGSCSVELAQMPGGMTFKSELQKNCFIDPILAVEVQQLLNETTSLPYEKYQTVFEKNLTLEFIAVDD